MKDPLKITWLKPFGDILNKCILLLLYLSFSKYLDSLQDLNILLREEEAIGRRAHDGEVCLATFTL